MAGTPDAGAAGKRPNRARDDVRKRAGDDADKAVRDAAEHMPPGDAPRRPAEGDVAPPPKRRLGRGLSALIAERGAAGAAPGTPGAAASAAGDARLRDLPIDDVGASTRQPRRSFDAGELGELSASIKSLGVVQPIVVRPAPDGAPAPWELIAGERRLRAARLAGIATIPALVRPADEAASLEIALAENVAREDLNAIEEALAYAALADEFGLTHDRIGELVGKSRVAVTNVLRLLDLPDEVREAIERGELSEGHGRALLGLADHLERRRVARLVMARGLTVRQTEALVRAAHDAAGAPRPAGRPAVDVWDDLVEELYGVLDVPVRIRSGKRGGSLELRFRDRDELERLVELLRSLK
jgi:ParB family chromosome partitioning protein